MAIELPKDAEGREIPLDTQVLYDEEGNPQDVARFTYSPRNMFLDKRWEVVFLGAFDRFASDMFLSPPEPPDSWEKLLDDLGATEDYANTTDNNYLDSPTCIYAHSIGKSCGSCKLYGGTSCTGKMCADIASRIRKLRGEC